MRDAVGSVNEDRNPSLVAFILNAVGREKEGEKREGEGEEGGEGGKVWMGQDLVKEFGERVFRNFDNKCLSFPQVFFL